MAYRQITDLSADITISLGGSNRKTGKKNPESVEGYYLGKREVADSKKKNGFSYIYFFQTSKGNIGVWGKTDIDRKLAQAELGQMTLVKFDKMVPTPNGDMYKYSVAQDSENVIEVSASSTSGVSSEDTAIDGTDTEELNGYDNEVDQDALQVAALAAAERKAKVQALLNRKSK